jgi:hypothetical protein
MKFRRILIALAAVAVAIAALVLGALERWRSTTRVLLSRLRAARKPPKVTRYSEAELAGLPAPVARYLRAVLHDGQAIITNARFTQRGEFQMGSSTNGWRPFTAIEDFTTSPAGFVWDARIRAFPLIDIHVRDGFVEGNASMIGSIAGLMNVVDAHDTPEMLEATLQRYLAEAPWFPTALLPSQGVEWTAIDENRARASLSVAGTTVSLDFTFGSDGLVASVFTPGRFYVDKTGSPVRRPWGAKFARYEERRRMLIPTFGEVEWQMPEGRLPYWRGKIVRSEYEYAE